LGVIGQHLIRLLSKEALSPPNFYFLGKLNNFYFFVLQEKAEQTPSSRSTLLYCMQISG